MQKIFIFGVQKIEDQLKIINNNNHNNNNKIYNMIKIIKKLQDQQII